MRHSTRIAVVTVSAALATALIGVAPAAASGKTCLLLVDPAGDAYLARNMALPTASLDIRSGDVASGATTVVAVLRLTTLRPESYTLLGSRWSLGFDIGSSGYAFTATRSTNGWYDGTLYANGVTTPAAFTVDFPGAVITWTAPRAAFPELAVPGAVFTLIHAATASGGVNSDGATSSGSYVDQTPSCVPAA